MSQQQHPKQQQQHPQSSDARLNANRNNAQHSTGPRTIEGKTISSQNAIKTALTGRTVLLPTDDADLYHSHLEAFRQEWQPSGQRETVLVQSLGDNAWRIERMASLEAAIYAKGRAFFAESYPHESAPVRKQLIELDIYQGNERELRNLALYESRLRRQRDRDLAELRFLQQERRRVLEEQQELAAHAYRKAKQDGHPFDPAALGFVFSNAEIETFIALRTAQRQIVIAAHPSSKAFRERAKAA